MCRCCVLKLLMLNGWCKLMLWCWLWVVVVGCVWALMVFGCCCWRCVVCRCSYCSLLIVGLMLIGVCIFRSVLWGSWLSWLLLVCCWVMRVCCNFVRGSLLLCRLVLKVVLFMCC